MKLRMIEIPASKSLLLTEYTDGLEQLFEINKEIQIRKILSTNVGSASASSVGGGGGGGGSSPAPPQFNIVGQSSTNQLSQTIAGQQNRPIQTYVVGNQVSTQQSLDRNAVATSTFG